MVLAIAMGAMIEGDAKLATRYCILATATALVCLATPHVTGLTGDDLFLQCPRQDGDRAGDCGDAVVRPRADGADRRGGCVGYADLHRDGYRMVGVGQLISGVAVTTFLLFKLGRISPRFLHWRLARLLPSPCRR